MIVKRVRNMANPGGNLGKVSLILWVLICFTLLPLNTVPTAMGGGDPYPTDQWTNHTAGDWYIDAGDTFVFKNGTLIVNGSLTINNTAALYLENMTVEMYGNITIERGGAMYLNGSSLIFHTPITLEPIKTSDDQQTYIYPTPWSIGLRNNGTLVITDLDHDPLTKDDYSVIRSNNTNGSYRYFWVNDVGSNLTLNNSIVRDCGWEMDVGFFGHPNPHAEHLGLTIMSNDTAIENVDFKDCYTAFVIFGSHNVSIRNCNITNTSLNVSFGALIFGGDLTNPLVGGKTNWTAHDITIANSRFRDCGGLPQVTYAYNITIIGNTFDNVSPYGEGLGMEVVKNVVLGGNTFVNIPFTGNESALRIQTNEDPSVFGVPPFRVENCTIINNTFISSNVLTIESYDYSPKGDIYNITVANNTFTGSKGVSIRMGYNTSIVNGTLWHNTFLNGTGGIRIEGANQTLDISVISNEFVNTLKPLEIIDCMGVVSIHNTAVIRGQTIYNGTGIAFEGAGAIEDLIIENNTFCEGAWGLSIYVSGSGTSNLTVMNNTIVGIQGNALDIRMESNGSLNAVISHNYISDATFPVYIRGNSRPYNIRMEHNTFVNLSYGVTVEYANDLVFTDNVVDAGSVNSITAGFSLKGTSGCLLQNNTVANFQRGYDVWSSTGLNYIYNGTLVNIGHEHIWVGDSGKVRAVNTGADFIYTWGNAYADVWNYLTVGTVPATPGVSVELTDNAHAVYTGATGADGMVHEIPCHYREFNGGDWRYDWDYHDVRVSVNSGQWYDVDVSKSRTVYFDLSGIVENTPPVLEPIGTVYAYAGEATNVTLHATDAEGDTLEFYDNVTHIPEWYHVPPTFFYTGTVNGYGNNATGYIVLSPGTDDIGTHHIRIFVDDGNGINSVDYEDITVVVYGSHNHAPVLQPIADRTVELGGAVNITVVAADEDGDDLIFGVNSTDLDLDMAVVNSTGGYGLAYLRFVADNVSLVGDHYVNVSVRDVNDTGSMEGHVAFYIHVEQDIAPWLEPVGNYTVRVGDGLSISAVAHDPNSYDAISFHTNSSIFVVETLDEGPGNALGLINYTPTYKDIGRHYVNISAWDMWGGYDWENVVIDVLPAPQPPRIDAVDDVSVYVGERVEVLIHAHDPDVGDVLEFDIHTPGIDLTVLNDSWDNATALIEWLPGEGDVGEHIINVSARDKFNLMGYLEFSIHVMERPELTTYNISIGPFVYENTTTALVGARVVLSNATEAQESYTDVMGYANFTDVYPGTYNCTFVYGNITIHFVVTIRPGGEVKAVIPSIPALIDTDGDGLPDIEDRDDDNDGFPDDWELALGTDPLDPSDRPSDTDGDGLPDGDSNNTLPWMDKDDDNDGMPDDWELRYGLDPKSASDSMADRDGDGLANLYEYENGTSPISNDTDGDGMDDWWELRYGLNATLDDAMADSDGDGYSNLDEYMGGSDPTDPESVPVGKGGGGGGYRADYTWAIALGITGALIVVLLVLHVLKPRGLDPLEMLVGRVRDLGTAPSTAHEKDKVGEKGGSAKERAGEKGGSVEEKAGEKGRSAKESGMDVGGKDGPRFSTKRLVKVVVKRPKR